MKVSEYLRRGSEQGGEGFSDGACRDGGGGASAPEKAEGLQADEDEHEQWGTPEAGLRQGAGGASAAAVRAGPGGPSADLACGHDGDDHEDDVGDGGRRPILLAHDLELAPGAEEEGGAGRGGERRGCEAGGPRRGVQQPTEPHLPSDKMLAKVYVMANARMLLPIMAKTDCGRERRRRQW